MTEQDDNDLLEHATLVILAKLADYTESLFEAFPKPRDRIFIVEMYARLATEVLQHLKSERDTRKGDGS